MVKLNTLVFPSPCNSTSFLTSQCTNSTTSLSFPTKTHNLSFLPNTCSNASLPQFNQTHLHFRLFLGLPRSGFPLFALNKRGKGGIHGFDDEEEEEEEEAYDDEDDDYEEEDEEEEILLPFDKMKIRTKNKPRGFGVGKVYDTCIEDKLLEEMEQSIQAQDINVSKLKNEPISPSSKKDNQKSKAPEVVPSGVRVRVVNLPKKKNIHRDLKSAFVGVPGIRNIIPAVFGNKKTRDPVCKGFAFVDFKSEEDATRFVQMFSRQTIMFGKIQKQINCDIIQSPSSAHVQSTDIPYTSPPLTVLALEEDLNKASNVVASSLGSWEEITSDELDNTDDEFVRAEVGDSRENLETVGLLKINVGDNSMEPRKDSLTDSSSSKLERVQVLEKKLLAKGKGEKVPEKKLHAKVKGEKVPEKKLLAKEKRVKIPKLDIPGSAKRLRVKEKAVLNDVFAKYRVQAAMASKEGS
uniref:RRM domain-containing protein n=1 Tax=Fagus sylvatica TaxID=28930 RepID=A0A2N9EC14_FAGSY